MEYLARTPRQLREILRGHRRQKRLSQTDAGSRVGLLPKTISLLESEPERSSLESLFKLLSALGLELVLREKAIKAVRKGEW
ncbi:MAG: helix-turn-helix domain-containing protein [Betaproteobacteria bacterium]